MVKYSAGYNSVNVVFVMLNLTSAIDVPYMKFTVNRSNIGLYSFRIDVFN